MCLHLYYHFQYKIQKSVFWYTLLYMCKFSVIFQGVNFLSFSRLCIFHSGFFQVWFFYHFPGCDFSDIFQGVHCLNFLSFSRVWLFYHFPGCTFSILAFSSCLISVIFQYVLFLLLSMVCIFHSGIFQVVHFPGSAFSKCVFSYNFQGVVFLTFSMVYMREFSTIFQGVSFLSFSSLCIFHSGILQECKICHFPVCAFSLIFHGVHFQFQHFPGCALSR